MSLFQMTIVGTVHLGRTVNSLVIHVRMVLSATPSGRVASVQMDGLVSYAIDRVRRSAL